MISDKNAKRLVRASIESRGDDVDRVAKSLYLAADTGGAEWDEYIGVNSSYVEVWRDMARAAIEAMR